MFFLTLSSQTFSICVLRFEWEIKFRIGKATVKIIIGCYISESLYFRKETGKQKCSQQNGRNQKSLFQRDFDLFFIQSEPAKSLLILI
jgi:hypothetical protein